MGKTMRGKRDGSGPYNGSIQNQKVGKGRRQLSGQACPKKKGK